MSPCGGILRSNVAEVAERDPFVDRLRRGRRASVGGRLIDTEAGVLLLGDQPRREHRRERRSPPSTVSPAHDERHPPTECADVTAGRGRAGPQPAPTTRPRAPVPRALVGGSVVACVSVTLALSVDGLTIRAALIAGLAIVALLLTGWRKPARAESRSPRGPFRRDRPRHRRRSPRRTARTTVPGAVRRTLALTASGGIGILTGVLTAIIVSFTIAWAVIWLTNLLRQ